MTSDGTHGANQVPSLSRVSLGLAKVLPGRLGGGGGRGWLEEQAQPRLFGLHSPATGACL